MLRSISIKIFFILLLLNGKQLYAQDPDFPHEFRGERHVEIGGIYEYELSNVFNLVDITWSINGGTVTSSPSSTFRQVRWDSYTGGVGVYYHYRSQEGEILAGGFNIAICVIPNGGSNFTLCKGTPFPKLTGVPAWGTWSGPYVSSDGTISTDIPPGSHRFTYTTGTCYDGSPMEHGILVEVIEQFAKPSVSESIIYTCKEESHTITATSSQGNVFRWYAVESGSASPVYVGNQFTFSPHDGLAYDFYVCVLNQNCESPRTKVSFLPYQGDPISGGTTSCAPAIGTLTVTTSHEIDHWERSSTGGASWDPVSNPTTSKSYNYTIEENALIRAVLKTGICLTPSQYATITVKKSVGGTPIVNYTSTSCGRLTGTIDLGSSAKGDIKEWYSSDDAVTWTAVTPFSQSLSFDLADNKYYQAKVQFETCPPAFSSVLAIKPKPYAGKVTLSSTISCETASGKVELMERYGNILYWQSSKTPADNNSWATVPNSAGPVYNFSNINESTGFRAAVSLADCPTNIAYSDVVSVKITPRPHGVISINESTNRTVDNCKDEEGKVVLTGEFKLKDYSGTIAGWEKLDNSNPSWVPIANTSAKDAYQYNVNITTKFRVRLATGGCDAIYSGEATIRVNHAFEGVKSAPKQFVNEYDGYSYRTTGTGSVILGKGFKFSANNCQDFEISIDPNYVVAYSNENFVLTETVTKEGIKKPEEVDWLNAYDKTSSFDYYDDLGRPVQKVIRKGSPLQNDLVTPIVYDRTGKQQQEFLPYVADTKDGSLKEDFARKQAEFYTKDGDQIANTLFPYSTKVLDESPFNRIKEQGSVGELYQPAVDGSGKTVKIAYLFNTETDIKVWEIAEGLPVSSKKYAALELRVTATTNLHGFATRQYNDWLGRLVYEKTESRDAADHVIWLQTYYIYDDFGNLNFVLPPEAVNQLSGNPSDAFLQQWAYCYEFDEKQRAIGKRVPGSEWVYSFYDRSDRLILSQDGNQREKKAFTFAKYDYLGRAVMSGIWKDAADLSRAVIQANVEGTSEYSEEKSEDGHGYTLDKIYPTVVSGDVLSVTYYDDYDFIGKSYFAGASTAYNYVAELGNGPFNPLIRGKSTGSKIKILNGSTYLKSVAYYDNRYQAIQSVKDSHLAGLDRVTTKCDFAGQVTQTLQTHTAKGKTTTILDSFDFDHMGRVITHRHKINAAPAIILAQYEYNELGQLVDKNIQPTPTGFLQSVDYRYNLKGSLTHINNKDLAFDGAATNDDNSDLFGLELNYDTNLQIDPSKAQFNGNIAEVLWKNDRDKKLTGYSFSYDPLSRLKGAAYKANEGNWTSGPANGNYNEDLPEYDYNGNIKLLTRKGLTGFTSTKSPVFGAMDQLHYHYKGNQLLAVVDDYADYTLPDIGKYDDFSDGDTENVAFDPANPATWDYTYDKNGNLTSDKNKGITSITYNALDLPERITFSDGKSILYTYDAKGSKLREEVFGLPAASIADYVGSFQYKNNEIQQIFTSEGRLIPANATTYRYEYSLNDHSGNVRLWFDEDPVNAGKARILQCQDYYPTGLKLSNSFNSNEQNNYLYNGKEWQGDLGLNWYAYGARMLDPAIARWNGIDAKAESYYHCSPYAYADNNPINNTDPDGNTTVYGGNGAGYAQNYAASIVYQHQQDAYQQLGQIAGYTNMARNYFSQYTTMAMNKELDYAIANKTYGLDRYDELGGLQASKVTYNLGFTKADALNALWGATPIGAGVNAYNSFKNGNYLEGALHTATALAPFAGKFVSYAEELSAGRVASGGMQILSRREMAEIWGGGVSKAEQGGFGSMMEDAEASRYAKYWENYAPKQISPGTTRMDWERVSGRTGRMENSRVIYDDYGRQIYRVDFSDHMRPLDHSTPHLHQYQYGPRFDPIKGAETLFNFW